MLTEKGAGASASRDSDEGEGEDYDAEALRLGLTKMDEGMWSDPETGALVDRDDLDDRLDAEEDEADFRALTESENHSPVITDAEEAAWARTVQIANIAAGKRGAN